MTQDNDNQFKEILDMYPNLNLLLEKLNNLSNQENKVFREIFDSVSVDKQNFFINILSLFFQKQNGFDEIILASEKVRDYMNNNMEINNYIGLIELSKYSEKYFVSIINLMPKLIEPKVALDILNQLNFNKNLQDLPEEVKWVLHAKDPLLALKNYQSIDKQELSSLNESLIIKILESKNSVGVLSILNDIKNKTIEIYMDDELKELIAQSHNLERLHKALINIQSTFINKETHQVHLIKKLLSETLFKLTKKGIEKVINSENPEQAASALVKLYNKQFLNETFVSYINRKNVIEYIDLLINIKENKLLTENNELILTPDQTIKMDDHLIDFLLDINHLLKQNIKETLALLNLLLTQDAELTLKEFLRNEEFTKNIIYFIQKIPNEKRKDAILALKDLKINFSLIGIIQESTAIQDIDKLINYFKKIGSFYISQQSLVNSNKTKTNILNKILIKEPDPEVTFDVLVKLGQDKKNNLRHVDREASDKKRDINLKINYLNDNDLNNLAESHHLKNKSVMIKSYNQAFYKEEICLYENYTEKGIEFPYLHLAKKFLKDINIYTDSLWKIVIKSKDKVALVLYLKDKKEKSISITLEDSKQIEHIIKKFDTSLNAEKYIISKDLLKIFLKNFKVNFLKSDLEDNLYALHKLLSHENSIQTINFIIGLFEKDKNFVANGELVLKNFVSYINYCLEKKTFSNVNDLKKYFLQTQANLTVDGFYFADIFLQETSKKTEDLIQLCIKAASVNKATEIKHNIKQKIKHNEKNDLSTTSNKASMLQVGSDHSDEAKNQLIAGINNFDRTKLKKTGNNLTENIGSNIKKENELHNENIKSNNNKASEENLKINLFDCKSIIELCGNVVNGENIIKAVALYIEIFNKKPNDKILPLISRSPKQTIKLLNTYSGLVHPLSADAQSEDKFKQQLEEFCYILNFDKKKCDEFILLNYQKNIELFKAKHPETKKIISSLEEKNELNDAEKISLYELIFFLATTYDQFDKKTCLKRLMLLKELLNVKNIQVLSEGIKANLFYDAIDHLTTLNEAKVEPDQLTGAYELLFNYQDTNAYENSNLSDEKKASIYATSPIQAYKNKKKLSTIGLLNNSLNNKILLLPETKQKEKISIIKSFLDKLEYEKSYFEKINYDLRDTILLSDDPLTTYDSYKKLKSDAKLQPFLSDDLLNIILIKIKSDHYNRIENIVKLLMHCNESLTNDKNRLGKYIELILSFVDEENSIFFDKLIRLLNLKFEIPDNDLKSILKNEKKFDALIKLAPIFKAWPVCNKILAMNNCEQLLTQIFEREKEGVDVSLIIDDAQAIKFNILSDSDKCKGFILLNKDHEEIKKYYLEKKSIDGSIDFEKIALNINNLLDYFKVCNKNDHNLLTIIKHCEHEIIKKLAELKDPLTAAKELQTFLENNNKLLIELKNNHRLFKNIVVTENNAKTYINEGKTAENYKIFLKFRPFYLYYNAKLSEEEQPLFLQWLFQTDEKTGIKNVEALYNNLSWIVKFLWQFKFMRKFLIKPIIKFKKEAQSNSEQLILKTNPNKEANHKPKIINNNTYNYYTNIANDDNLKLVTNNANKSNIVHISSSTTQINPNNGSPFQKTNSQESNVTKHAFMSSVNSKAGSVSSPPLLILSSEGPTPPPPPPPPPPSNGYPSLIPNSSPK